MVTNQFQELIAKNQLTKYSDRLCSKALKSIELCPVAAKDENLPIGATKLGGHPDVPLKFKWPKKNGVPLFFVAQINFAELPDGGSLDLPKEGLLSLFHDSRNWGFAPEDKDGFSVCYFEGAVSDSNRMPPPKFEDSKMFGLIKSEKTNEFGCCALRPTLIDTLPDDYWDELKLSDYELNDYSNLLDEIEGNHRMGGYPVIVQNPMELQCQLVTNGLYCGDATGFEDPRAAELEKNAGDWRLLLQIGSEELADIMWGDLGRLYVWIKQQDLAQKNFSKSWVILQCH